MAAGHEESETATQVSRIASPATGAAGDESLRILLVTIGYPPVLGGIELHVSEVARRLARRGHQVTVLTADRTHRLPPHEDDAGVEVIRVRAWPRGSNWSFVPQMRSVIGERRWDVMHLHSFHTFVAPIALATARRARLPYVVTFHGGGAVVRRPVRRLQLRALAPLLRKAARLVAVAPFEIELFGRLLGVGPDRFALIANGSDLPRPAGEADPADRLSPVIATVGRLERAKGHQRIIDALPHVVTALPQARLWIAGAGPYEPDLRRLAEARGVGERVEIRAYGTDERTAYATDLGRAAVFVLMSDFETQPLAVLEAASLGLPCVVSDVSGLRQLAEQGLAVTVPLDSTPSALGAAIREQIQAPRPTRALLLPTWDECVDELETVYRECAA